MKSRKPVAFRLICLFIPFILSLSGQSSTTLAAVNVQDTDVVRVNTNLVSVPVTVKSKNGKFVPTLQLRDFRVFEDGIEQQIAYLDSSEQPLSVVILLDYTCSMLLNLQDVKIAAIDFLDQLRPIDNVRAVRIGDDIDVLYGGMNNLPLLREAILKTGISGTTKLYDAIHFVNKYLLQTARGRKAVIVLTDGVDTGSRYATYSSTLRDAEMFYVPTFTVKFGSLPDRELPLERQGRHYLLELAEKTGGKSYLSYEGGSTKKALAAIITELKSQYVISYYAAGAEKGGKRHKIKVLPNLPNVSLRARTSYMIGSKVAGN